MNEIDYLKKIILCTDDVITDIYYLHIRESIIMFLLYI
jgi:hypothetical protein